MDSKCLQATKDKKMNKQQELPSVEDFSKLCSGLAEEGRKRLRAHENNPTTQSWRALAEAILAYLTIFNGKRGGDVSQMKLIDFVRSNNIKRNLSDVIYGSLSDEEKEFASRHHLVTVKGKNQTPNSIIMTTEVKTSMDSLLTTRESCGILRKNIFFFAVPKTESSFLRYSRIVTKFTHAFGVSNCKTTMIRKLISTTLQVNVFLPSI